MTKNKKKVVRLILYTALRIFWARMRWITQAINRNEHSPEEDSLLPRDLDRRASLLILAGTRDIDEGFILIDALQPGINRSLEIIHEAASDQEDHDYRSVYKGLLEKIPPQGITDEETLDDILVELILLDAGGGKEEKNDFMQSISRYDAFPEYKKIWIEIHDELVDLMMHKKLSVR